MTCQSRGAINASMLRPFPLLFLALAGTLACDRDAEQPRGGAWQPCLSDSRCSEEMMLCEQAWGASDVTVCAPTCQWGETCPSPPSSEDGRALTARCNAYESSPAGYCVVDCATATDCPAGMLCFFDDRYTPSTNLGICAWPPP